MKTCIVALLLCPLLLPAQNAVQSEKAAARTFEFGFEQRVRNENWNNILDYSDAADDEREQLRYRTRVWAKAPLSSSIDVVAGLNSETNQRFGKINKFDEIVFDTAYIDFKRLFTKGLALRVGRQNISKGEGFLFLEGDPGDGSRSIYFNAANLSYSFRKSKIELIGIFNPAYDRFLPAIHSQHKNLIEWNETAAGIYYTGNDMKNTGIEAYYFYKREFHDVRPVTNAQFQPDRHVSLLGGRLTRRLPRGWSATAEYAAEWGAQHPNTEIAAWGGYGYLKRTFAHKLKPYALAGYWAFSGDDPATNKIEGFEPLFARWPKWSELYIYSQVPEKGVGYWTNTGMWQGEAGFSPAKPFDVRFTYYHMSAFHPFAGNPRVFGAGTRRGDNVQARLDFAVNRDLKGHVVYETHLPGDFYQGRNTGYFLRFEMIYQLKTTLPAEELRHSLLRR